MQHPCPACGQGACHAALRCEMPLRLAGTFGGPASLWQCDQVRGILLHGWGGKQPLDLPRGNDAPVGQVLEMGGRMWQASCTPPSLALRRLLYSCPICAIFTIGDSREQVRGHGHAQAPPVGGPGSGLSLALCCPTLIPAPVAVDSPFPPSYTLGPTPHITSGPPQ